MTANGVASDGKAKTDTLAVGVARFIKAGEGAESFFAVFRCNAGAVIVNQDLDPLARSLQGQRDRL